MHPYYKSESYGTITTEEISAIEGEVIKDKTLIGKQIKTLLITFLKVTQFVFFNIGSIIPIYALFLAILKPDLFLLIIHTIPTLNETQISNAGSGLFYLILTVALVVMCLFIRLKSFGYIDHKDIAIKRNIMLNLGLTPTEENIKYFHLVQLGEIQKQKVTKLRIVD